MHVPLRKKGYSLGNIGTKPLNVPEKHVNTEQNLHFLKLKILVLEMCVNNTRDY